MQINYCHLPSEAQKHFAEYLGKRWGEIVKFNYLAIVTNPNPPREYLIANQNQRRSKYPTAIAYYSPLTGGYIGEAIPCTTKVLSMGSHKRSPGERTLLA